MRLPCLARRAPVPRRTAAPATALALALALAAGLTLAGCDRPTPLVTMQSGGNFVKTNAAQYVRDGSVIENAVTPPNLRAQPGSSINIDVPTSVAGRGYFLSVNNQRITETITSPHYRYTLPNVQGTVNLVVFGAPRGAQSTTASGSWPFQVTIRP